MRNISVFLCLIWLISGCYKNIPNPSWIKIDKFSVVANPNLTDGELSFNNFSNGWVYIDDKFIGIFELPCKIPVKLSGSVSIKVYPTILNNGISATKKNYPFTKAYQENIVLLQNDTISISPVTNYLDGTHFIIEDFQGGANKISPGTNTTTNLLIETENGNSYGRVYLTPESNYWSAYMSSAGDNEPFTFAIGNQVFLELECKNDQPFITTFIYGKQDGSITEQNNIRISNINTNWKKIYIELTELVTSSGGNYFWFGFTCTLPEGQSNATVLLDNIKIVYR
ncbi:MAG: hypothetical protein M9916_11920 [Crocinitomicaceae bacterium]|nr:hypothetical protein [Crocinitomicaceae bacterium]